MKRIEVIFPEAPPEPMLQDTARYRRNVRSGADFEMLERFILEHLPFISRKDVTTIYQIVFTERDEQTPSAYPKLSALVRVGCAGSFSDDWRVVEGTYKVTLKGDAAGTIARFQKLNVGSEMPEDFTYGTLPRIKELYAELSSEIIQTLV